MRAAADETDCDVQAVGEPDEVMFRAGEGPFTALRAAQGKPTVADIALPWGREEAQFVTELQAGSEEAFDCLVLHYHAPVYSLLYGMLGNSADAADVSQEVFLKAFRGIGKFRRGSSLKTWLYRIAVREALNHRRWSWRHLRNQVSIDAEQDGAENAGHAAMELEDGAATPFEQMAASEVQQAVWRGLREVPEVFRGAVMLRDLEGLSYEEVAEVLDVSVGTVKSRILRGRAALREALRPVLEGQRARSSFEPAGATDRPLSSLRMTASEAEALGGAE